MKTLEQELIQTATLVAQAVTSVHAALEQEAARQGTTVAHMAEVAEAPLQDRASLVRTMERKHERAVAAIHAKWKRY